MKPDPCPDDRLRRSILAGLASDDRTAFADLRVGVVGSIAYLAGMVSSLEISLAAAEIAGSVPGICGVINRIGTCSQISEVNLPARGAERLRRDQWRASEDGLQDGRQPRLRLKG